MANVNNEKQNLVLIPGLNNTGEIWDQTEKYLPENIHLEKVTCPAISTVEQMAKELLTELPEKFYLGGFSFGGFVALEILRTAPERIQGIALIATSVTADTEQRKEARKKAIARAASGEYEEMIGSQSAKIFHPDNLENPELQNLRKKMLVDYGVERFIAHQEASMTRLDSFELLKQFNKPILIVTGSDDQVFSVEAQRELAEKLSGASFQEIPKSGHMMPMEQPEAFASHLQNWMMK